MRHDLTDITIVLDRSGSMNSVRDDTIGGFNAFLRAQRELPGECLVSLVQFNVNIESVYTARPVREAPCLTADTYVPMWGTALLDAIGMTMTNTGKRLEQMPRDARPGKVIVVIMTDGFGNASKQYTRERVFDLIKVQRDVYSWQVVFLGANQDAIQEGAKYGIAASDTLNYGNTARGISHAFASTNAKVERMRAGLSGEAAAFTPEDRERQLKEGAQ